MNWARIAKLRFEKLALYLKARERAKNAGVELRYMGGQYVLTSRGE